MERDRWVEIDNLLRSVLDQPAAQRETFLEEACASDGGLRAEVESLLNEHDDSEAFLEDPALAVAARSLALQKTSLIGTLVGPYKILECVGAGGMGEVFLAQDTRLNRSVALKVLPPEFAVNPKRVERFEQEARAASALNHPNVLVIYDVGVHHGMPYIAGEYLEGETLRERLNRTPLPLAKALDFAIEIAHGVAAAHDIGIVHRDLKPENIFITAEGRIKILDFGLAKLAETTRPLVRESAGEVLTAPGVILGSAGYLSPEQIRAQPVGLNSDIFSFGCVFYEMLTGNRAFSGSSGAETMAAILRDEPLSLDGFPPALTRIVRHCLEKNASERFKSVSDVAFALEAFRVPAGPAAPASLRRRFPRGRGAFWIVLAALCLVGLAVIGISIKRPVAVAPVVRFEIPIPADPITSAPAIAISPDGEKVAFVALGSGGHPVLWVRSLSALAPRSIPGTENVRYPFWSADNRFLAYQVGDRLRSLEMQNGNQRTICTVDGIVNGAWNIDNVLIVSTGKGPLLRIPFGGGRFEPVTTLDPSSGQRAHWWPSFLPDNRHFLYSVNASSIGASGIFVGSLNGDEPKRLVSGVLTNAVYVPPGYLLYSRDGDLVARKFDPVSLQLRGSELRVADHLKVYYGYTAFSASLTGAVVFRSGDQGRYQLGWFDRSGKPIASPVGSAEKRMEGILPLAPSLSPNGSMLATVQYRSTNGAYGIWTTALNSAGIEVPVTDTPNAESAVWSPDGTRIAYSASPSGGPRDLYVKRLDEAGKGKLVLHSARDKWPLDWSADGKDLLLFYEDDSESHSSLWVSPVNGSAPAREVQGAPPDVKDASFSPDGHWLAYSSKQSGPSLIYVQDFPAGETRVPVSGRGAQFPQWRRDGKELFYISSENALVSVPVLESGGFAGGVPVPVFSAPFAGPDPYAFTPDAKRFVVQMPVRDTTMPVISVVLNWPNSLRH